MSQNVAELPGRLLGGRDQGASPTPAGGHGWSKSDPFQISAPSCLVSAAVCRVSRATMGGGEGRDAPYPLDVTSM